MSLVLMWIPALKVSDLAKNGLEVNTFEQTLAAYEGIGWFMPPWCPLVKV